MPAGVERSSTRPIGAADYAVPHPAARHTRRAGSPATTNELAAVDMAIDEAHAPADPGGGGLFPPSCLQAPLAHDNVGDSRHAV